MPGRSEGFDLVSKVLADPGQLREVLAGCSHRGNAARQLADHPGRVTVSADPEGIGAFELKQIGELVEAAGNIGIEDRHEAGEPIRCDACSKHPSGLLRIDPDQYHPGGC